MNEASPYSVGFIQQETDTQPVTFGRQPLLNEGPKSVVVVGVEPEDIQPFGLELTATVAAKLDEMVLRVVDELKNLGVEPEKKV